MNPPHFFLAFLGLTLWPMGSAIQATDGPRGEVAPKLAADGPAEDLEGYYECHGDEGGGKKYRGVVTIVRHNEVYFVTWSIVDGGSFSGVAVRMGDTLATASSIPRAEGKPVSVANLYRIEMAGGKLTLKSRWATFPGDGKTRTEKLTFIKAMAPEDD